MLQFLQSANPPSLTLKAPAARLRLRMICPMKATVKYPTGKKKKKKEENVQEQIPFSSSVEVCRAQKYLFKKYWLWIQLEHY